MDISQIVYRIAVGAPVFLLAIVLHEWAHAYVALRFGDTTARDAGRLTLNPAVHLDLVGTIIFPLLGAAMGWAMFGWAKPVPINMATVIRRGGYNAAMQVDLAGIVYNFTLAVIASIVVVAMAQPTTADSLVYLFTYIFMFQLLVINVVLGVFNLLPVPQFDGAHFLMHLSLKYKINAVAEFFYKNERYGIIVVLVILMTPLKDYLLFLPVQTILGLLIS